MPKFQIDVGQMDAEVKAANEVGYMTASASRVRQPLAFWLMFRVFQARARKTDISVVLESVLRKAYNAGCMDDIKNIDGIVKDAFGDLAKSRTKPKSKRARKPKPNANADKLASALDSALE